MLRLDARLVNGTDDRSGNGNLIQPHGDVALGADGAIFDGHGDYLVVSRFEYASDSVFTIGIWMVKDQSAEACADDNIYEYLFSHSAFLDVDIADLNNSNVNMFLGCESNGGGWSTTGGGSIMRFNMVDQAQRFARFDVPLHEPGQILRITRLWMHFVFVVDIGTSGASARATAYIDAREVPGSAYGFYRYANALENQLNLAYPHPGEMKGTMAGFNLFENIYIGSRSDLSSNRFFAGRLAGVVVSTDAFSASQVTCVFDQGETFLPTVLQECQHTAPAKRTLNLLMPDTSIRMGGHAHVTSQGAEFDGDGDYISISNFEYASDTTFTISLWATKNNCTGGLYEYLYSHQHDADPNTWEHNAYALIMFACEGTHGGSSSTLGGGSFIRYDLQDDNAQRATFDFSLHNAGDFDSITDTWLHVILSVTPTGIKTFEDGSLVPDTEYGFFSGLVPSRNVARATPGVLSQRLATLTLETDIFLGGRADLHPERHFQGRIAMVSVYSRALTATEADCVFHAGDATLPSPVDLYNASGNFDPCFTAFALSPMPSILMSKLNPAARRCELL